MKTLFRTLVAGSLAVAALFAATPKAEALVSAYLYESGGDVIGVHSGSIDLTGLFRGPTPSEAGFVAPSDGFYAPLGTYQFYSGMIAAPSFGPGNITFASSTDGDVFGIGPNVFAVPIGYVSGDHLSGSMTFAGATLLSLGATPGEYTFTLPNDSFVLTVGQQPPAVPLPASLPLLAVGFGGLALLRRRQRA